MQKQYFQLVGNAYSLYCLNLKQIYFSNNFYFNLKKAKVFETSKKCLNVTHNILHVVSIN